VRLLSYGEEIRGKLGVEKGRERERERMVLLSSWNFYSNECVAPAMGSEGRNAPSRLAAAAASPPISAGSRAEEQPRQPRDLKPWRDVSIKITEIKVDYGRPLTRRAEPCFFLLRYSADACTILLPLRNAVITR